MSSAKMIRFVQFQVNNVQKLGVQMGNAGGNIIELHAHDKHIPNNLVDFLRGGKTMLERAYVIVQDCKSSIPIDKVTLLPPVTRPDKVACVGLNYKDHCEEQNVPVPKEPLFFNKFPSTITAPSGNIHYPDITEKLDWEVELAVIIGKGGKNIPKSQALDHVFGYTVANDITARDWQKDRNGKQWLLGKSMDNFCPLGPAVVTKESISDVNNLAIKCIVNGEVKQNSNTKQLVHKVDEIIAFLSNICTLLPGDVILTGTPPGVGVCSKPPQFLKRGDVVECEIEHIGSIKNKVV